MSDYLEDNPSEVKNAAYYRRQMKELERENAELKQQIKDLSKNKIQNDTAHYHQCAKLVDERDELKRIIAESNKPKPSRIHSCDIEGCAVCDPTHGL